MFSCLGQIPREDVDKQSSSSGVTWTPTSTGLEALLSSPCEGEGGLSTALSMHRVPLHCFLLCSIKIRISPRGKFIWHWPQVSRSWSPSGATCTSPCCSCLSSETTDDRGSAARGKHRQARHKEWERHTGTERKLAMRGVLLNTTTMTEKLNITDYCYLHSGIFHPKLFDTVSSIHQLKNFFYFPRPPHFCLLDPLHKYNFHNVYFVSIKYINAYGRHLQWLGQCTACFIIRTASIILNEVYSVMGFSAVQVPFSFPQLEMWIHFFSADVEKIHLNVVNTCVRLKQNHFYYLYKHFPKWHHPSDTHAHKCTVICFMSW